MMPRSARSARAVAACLSTLALTLTLGAWCAGCAESGATPAGEPAATATNTVAATGADGGTTAGSAAGRERSVEPVSPVGAGAQGLPRPRSDLSPASAPPAKATTLPLARAGSTDAVDVALAAGDAAEEKGDLAAAAEAYASARKLAPKRAEPRVGEARTQILKLDLAMDYGIAKGNAAVLAAAKELGAAARSDATCGAAQVELGRAWLLLGDAPAALTSLRKGAELLPNEAEAHSALGVALLATGDKAGALREMQQASVLDAGSAPRHGNLGTVFFMLGRVPEAVQEYRAQLALQPGDARAHADLGTALLAQNDFTAAMPELEKAIALDPARATFRSNLGYALQLQGKIDAAIAAYREAIRLDPQLASAWINLATALAKDPKRRGEARRALEAAKKIDPTDPRVKANLDELDAMGTP
jgi:tetratricopeptide (TPR) repeat protein